MNLGIQSADTYLRIGLWIILVWSGIAFLLRRRSVPSRSIIVLAMVVFAAALAVRILLPPWAPLHGDQHGMAEVRSFLGPDKSESFHGFGYGQFVRATLRFLPHNAHSVFLVAALAGSAASALLLMAGTALTGSLAAGTVAAFGLALDPAFARISTSESPWAFALMMFLVSFLAGALLFSGDGIDDRQKRRLGWVWACSLALGCEVHIETVLLLPDAFFLLWALFPQWEAWVRNSRFLLAPAGLLFLKAGIHAWLVRGEGAAELRHFGAFGFPPSGTSDLLAYASLSPMLLLPLAIIGAVLAQGWRLQVALAYSTLSIVIPAMNVNVCRTDLIRYQTASHLFLYLLASLVTAAVARRGGNAVLAAALPIGFWIANAAYWAPSSRTRNIDDVAFELVARAAPSIPPDATLLLPARFDSHSDLGVEFPEYLFPDSAAGLRLVHDPDPEMEAAVRQAGSKCFVYIGSGCYRFWEGESWKGIAPSAANSIAGSPVLPTCAAVASHADLRPVESLPLAVQTRPAWPDQEYMSVPGRLITVGFLPCK